ncbi:MAG: 5-formyltetrahydrofolate cyclo-ligase [Infirmifilum sp.]
MNVFPTEAKKVKEELRRKVWSRMVSEGVALPPFPVEGRIPNFRGAELAARRLAEDDIFQEAKVIFCNPDSPQRHVREAALRAGKVLIMASPRLRSGFLLLDSSRIPGNALSYASTIKGAFTYGRVLHSNVPQIDLKVSGSVAVSLDGGRVGKGGGFSDLEYAILREMRVIGEDTPVVTTVHDVQIVESIPMERHDVPLDRIYTPSKAIVTVRKYPRPRGIIWELLPEKQIEEIPLLRELRKNNKGRNPSLTSSPP